MKYLYFILIFEFLLSQYPMEYRFNNSDLYRYDAMSDSGYIPWDIEIEEIQI